MRQRRLAIVALLVAAAAVGLGISVAVTELPRGLVHACILIASVGAWYGVPRRGSRARWVRPLRV